MAAAVREAVAEVAVADEATCFYPCSLLLQWHLTERCNLGCTHCYQEGQAGAELGYSDWQEILDQFLDFLKSPLSQGKPPIRGHITLTGGEPFLLDDFFRLLETIAGYRDRLSFAILTNGTLIDRKAAKRLGKLRPGFVQLSLEGDAATHDRIRGTGNFKKTVAALKRLRRARIPALISFTAHPGNFETFPAVARVGRRMHVARVWADRLIPRGGGAGMESLSPEQTRRFLRILQREQRKAEDAWFGRTRIAMHRALQFLAGGGHPYHCTAGETLVTVQPNGDLLPCRRMPLVVGNLLKTPLTELYQTSALFQKLRSPRAIPRGCRNCAHQETCRGGLKCLSYARYGDPFYPDPGCWLAEHGKIGGS